MNMADLDIERLSARCSQHPESPLFARLADQYLALDRKEEALALCEKAAGLFPAYASGQLVLGKCYSALGRVREARAAYHRVLELAPYNAIVQNLLITLPASPAVIEEEESAVIPAAVESVQYEAPVEENFEPEAIVEPLQEQTLPAEESIEPEPFPYAPSLQPEEETEELASEEPAREESVEPSFEPFPTFEEYVAQHPTPSASMTLEDYLQGRAAARASSPAQHEETAATDLETLARQLQSAKRIVPAQSPSPASPVPSSDSTSSGSGAPRAIVTQTMAEIYASQNEFQAAIEAYQELIKRQPEQAQVFQQRIDAIRLLTGDV